MVARRSDAPRSPVARTMQNSEDLVELEKSLSRGTSALRNNADQRLLLDPQSQVPLLIPTNSEGADMGVALKFNREGKYGGALETRNTADDDWSDFATRFGSATEFLATGTISAGDFKTRLWDDGSATFANGTGGVFTGGGAYFGPTTIYNQGGIATTSDVTAPGQVLSTNTGNGATYAGRTQSYDGYFVHINGGVPVASSERRLKDHVEAIADGLEIVERLRPARWTWKDPDRDAGGGEPHRVHAGIYVDEVPDESRVTKKRPDPITGRPVPDGELTYERDAILAYLVAAVQTLAADNRALTARVEQLEG